MKTSEKGLALIKQFEGLKLDAYLDAVGIPTIAYGHTRGVKMGDTVTPIEAHDLLVDDVGDAEKCVGDACEFEPTQNQFDAMVCFAYNVGCAAFLSSTLLKLYNQGNTEAAQQQFARWNKAGGHVLEGLTDRREAEAELFGASEAA